MAFVLDITNKRTYVWIYFETSVYLLITKEDNTFAPNQSVSLTNLLKITQDDIVIVIPTYIANSGIFKGIVDESSVVQGKYDKNFTLIPGKLMLSSKITFGKTNKGLTKYQLKPLDNRFPKITVASSMKSNIDAYVKVEFDNNLKASLVEKICDVDEISKYENILISKNIPRIRNKLFKTFREFEYKSTEKYDEDWRKYRTFSIDPEGCCDVDDAVSLKSGEIAVHIATPTKLMNNELEDYVENTITSFYGSKETTHLLPDKVVECASLNENTQRYVLSVVFSKTKDTRLVRSIIKIDKNYSYENVLDTKDYKGLVENYDEIFGETIEDSHKIVENLMVQANSYVAEFLVENLNGDALIRKTFEDGTVNYNYYNEGDKNSHTGLNVDLYTHFTSPLRRYADQIVHRALFKILEKETKDKLEFDKILKLNRSKLAEKLLYSKLNVIDLISKDDVVIKGKLLYIEDGFARIENENLRISIPIVSRKIEDLVHIQKNEDIYEIVVEDITFYMNVNDEVEIKISYDKLKGIEGITYEWMSPNLCLV